MWRLLFRKHKNVEQSKNDTHKNYSFEMEIYTFLDNKFIDTKRCLHRLVYGKSTERMKNNAEIILTLLDAQVKWMYKQIIGINDFKSKLTFSISTQT